jgi:hypothetical protein
MPVTSKVFGDGAIAEAPMSGQRALGLAPVLAADHLDVKADETSIAAQLATVLRAVPST